MHMAALILALAPTATDQPSAPLRVKVDFQVVTAETADINKQNAEMKAHNRLWKKGPELPPLKVFRMPNGREVIAHDKPQQRSPEQ